MDLMHTSALLKMFTLLRNTFPLQTFWNGEKCEKQDKSQTFSIHSADSVFLD